MAGKTTHSSSPAPGTPSFICEVPLKVLPAQMRRLQARLEAARQLYNACLGEAKRRVGLIRQSRPFQQAHKLSKDDPIRRKLFAQARATYHFSEYALHDYAGTLRHSWLDQHLDSLTAQKLASRAYRAANRLLLGQAKRVRFKGTNQMDSVCPEVAPNARALRRFDRKLDRQRRANNPGNYDERGRVKRGKQRWHLSNRQRKTQALRREYYRKLAATRKRCHGQLAHQVMAQGNTFHVEALSYRAWQKRYGKSVGLCAPGMFMAHLSRLAASAGGKVVPMNARRAKLSQACHCGAVVKKQLSQRQHRCSCGVHAQRDLYSAFLARFVHPDTSLLNADQAAHAWSAGEPLLQAAFERAITNQPASGRTRPSSFGASPSRPSQSGSPAPGLPAKAKSQDGVAVRKRTARAWKRRR